MIAAQSGPGRLVPPIWNQPGTGWAELMAAHRLFGMLAFPGSNRGVPVQVGLASSVIRRVVDLDASHVRGDCQVRLDVPIDLIVPEIDRKSTRLNYSYRC